MQLNHIISVKVMSFVTLLTDYATLYVTFINSQQFGPSCIHVAHVSLCDLTQGTSTVEECCYISFFLKKKNVCNAVLY